VKCTGCGAEVERIECTINPRKETREFRTNCGHELTEDEARAAWRLGVEIGPVPEVNGATLIAAERARQIAEEGHTPEKDAELTGDELAWAAWCLLDRAAALNPPEQAPPVWPERMRDRWPTDKTPQRLLTIAGALIAAEKDRRRQAGETP
jgi:hypothetical protein